MSGRFFFCIKPKAVARLTSVIRRLRSEPINERNRDVTPAEVNECCYPAGPLLAVHDSVDSAALPYTGAVASNCPMLHSGK
jgi:hypothetical protein